MLPRLTRAWWEMDEFGYSDPSLWSGGLARAWRDYDGVRVDLKLTDNGWQLLVDEKAIGQPFTTRAEAEHKARITLVTHRLLTTVARRRKVSDTEREAIRLAIEEGEDPESVMSRFQVSKKTLQRIKFRRRGHG